MQSVAAAVAIMVPIGGVSLYVIRAEVDKKVGSVAQTIATVDGRIANHEAGCAVRQSALAVTLTDIKKQGERLEDKIDRLMEAK